MKHTPGPWTFTQEEGNYHIRSASGQSLMCDEHYYPWVPDGKDDWYLIAAAPELLEALKALTKRHVSLAGSGDCGFWEPEEEEEVINARAAILKAEGGAK